MSQRCSSIFLINTGVSGVHVLSGLYLGLLLACSGIKHYGLEGKIGVWRFSQLKIMIVCNAIYHRIYLTGIEYFNPTGFHKACFDLQSVHVMTPNPGD